MKKKQSTFQSHYLVNQNQILGSGSTGSVYLGTFADIKGVQIATGKQVAIKIIDLETIDNEVSEYLLKMEKNALLTLNHPNVLKCYQVYRQNKNCYFVTQYCNGGTLKDIIQQEGCLTQTKTMDIIEGLLNGYSQCIRKKVIHRDIKPANIMLHDGKPKLIDFGYCMIDGHTKPILQYNVGSPSYMAPESHQWNMYNEKTQIWAIGVTIFQCLTGKTLDQGRKMSDTFKQLLQKGLRFPDDVSQKCKKIISWCLQYDPKNRPTCLQLINSIMSDRKKDPSLSFLSATPRNSTYILRNPSYSFLNSSTPSKIPFSYNSSNKNLNNNFTRNIYHNHTPTQTLYDSVKINKNNQENKNQSLQRNRFNTKFDSKKPYEFITKIQNEVPVKTQRTANFMGSTNYFYNKLNCNTFR